MIVNTVGTKKPKAIKTAPIAPRAALGYTRAVIPVRNYARGGTLSAR
jgi:hypothetical protein